MANLQLVDIEPSIISSQLSINYCRTTRNNRWKRLLSVAENKIRRFYSGKHVSRKRTIQILLLLVISGITALLLVLFPLTLLLELEALNSNTQRRIWVSLLLTLPRHHRPDTPPGGVSSIVSDWKTPADSIRLLSPWTSDFTQTIIPLSCHSHNDYWRAVPLFEALAAGCTSVEADIFLPTETGSKDLLVGYKSGSLTQDRTLQSMYIKPLMSILENLNNNSRSTNGGEDTWRGVFQSSPDTTFTLLLDFKSNGAKLWPYVNAELESFRSRNWLTYWSESSGIKWAPIIIVASGNAPFELLVSNTTFRDIFYDAPLDDVLNPIYNDTNSYYASVSMRRAIGTQWLWKFNLSQLTRIRKQINAASRKGLKARYWDTPSWPVAFEDYVSGILVENGIGTLNVDRFSSTLYFPLLTRFVQNRLTW